MQFRCVPVEAILFCFMFAGVFCTPGSIRADEPGCIMPEPATSGLHDALDRMNLSESDLGFEKDVAEPEISLGWIRDLLDEPVKLCETGDSILNACERGTVENLFDLACDMLELEPTAVGKDDASNAAPEVLSSEGRLDPAILTAVGKFLESTRRAEFLVKDSVSGIPVSNRKAFLCSWLGPTYLMEDKPAMIDIFRKAGVDAETCRKVIDDGKQVDARPSAHDRLETFKKVELNRFLAGARLFHRAVVDLETSLSTNIAWPSEVCSLRNERGAVVIGTRSHDVYRGPALLILDPGGDDVYMHTAGVADGTRGFPLAAVVDLDGNDTYRSSSILGFGSAAFGVLVCRDLQGDDLYSTAFAGLAAAVFGVALLEDVQGDDVYRAYGPAQGAACAGVAMLIDSSGADLYDVGLCGQGFADVMGFGLLLDRAGNDRFGAGNRHPDFERHDDRFLSLSQGFAIGMRPFAGGGVGALVDLAGNDVYESDIYGQGVSYWYSVGVLIDRAGNDSYRVHQYGQGAGIHLSLGLLADLDGNDNYSGHTLTQGCGHDYAAGMLVDQGGSDSYTASSLSQGWGMNNALGMLLDMDGDDSYLAANISECQGSGNDGGHREYGSIGVLMDLGGRDSYSCGAVDGARLERGTYGIVYDSASETKEAE